MVTGLKGVHPVPVRLDTPYPPKLKVRVGRGVDRTVLTRAVGAMSRTSNTANLLTTAAFFTLFTSLPFATPLSKRVQTL